MPESILSFKLGPVQPFIESARTLRDLWSGSYLLSWLVAHAMKPLIGQPGVKFITPSIDLDTNELLRAVVEKKEDRKKPLTTTATLACLPHTFAAMVPLERAEDYKKEVLKGIDEEWKNIASAVHDALDGVFHKPDENWDTFWKGQVESYFEFRVVVLPLDQATHEVMEGLGIEEDDSQDTNENKLWGQQWNFAGALLDMARSVKHVPEYKLPPYASRFPVKCSLFGTFEQMGPAVFGRAKDFWEKVQSPTWDGIKGTRLHSNDKLCAISLIKRFAWPVYWSGKLNLDVRELRFLDTATMAAADWLEYKDPSANPEIKKIKHWEEQKGDWNGQWLHWPQRDSDEPHCPETLFNAIKDKKRDYTSPPTYYALLMLDGDNMGEVFQGDIGKPFGNGLERFQKLAKQLTSFGLEVKKIVEAHNGELIYSGGDDVLAFLPTTRAVDCAKEIREAFGVQIPGASLSGGIAVVHYKEDLRFALGQVRSTEKAAKGIGKKRGVKSVKDAFGITICKRSGEHSTVVMGWGQTELLQKLVTLFKAGATDRWVYKLREEMPTLTHLGLDAAKAETLRLVNRGEFGKISKTEFVGVIGALFDAYKIEMKDSKRNWEDKEVLEGFVGLCQSASFLARGKE